MAAAAVGADMLATTGAIVTAEKIRALERLASDPGAAPNERSNARSAAAKLRMRSPEPFARSEPEPRVRPTSSGFDVWEGAEPVHGPRCYQSYGGCQDCQRIQRFRSWLLGSNHT